jgi:hypothetical protein
MHGPEEVFLHVPHITATERKPKRLSAEIVA